MMLNGLLATKGDVKAAKALALEKLARLGIKDSFTVKLKKPTAPDGWHWVAQYRGRSQFRAGPIFWVSPEHPKYLKELTISLLHEYGHVIYEFFRYRAPEHLDDIDAMFASDEDNYQGEEEFAESFARSVYAERDDQWVKRVVAEYLAAGGGA